MFIVRIWQALRARWAHVIYTVAARLTGRRSAYFLCEVEGGRVILGCDRLNAGGGLCKPGKYCFFVEDCLLPAEPPGSDEVSEALTLLWPYEDTLPGWLLSGRAKRIG